MDAMFMESSLISAVLMSVNRLDEGMAFVKQPAPIPTLTTNLMYNTY